MFSLQGCKGLGSISGQGTKILQAGQCSQKKKKSTLGAIMEQMISKILILISYDHIKGKRKNWKVKFSTVTYLLILHDML